MTATSQQDLAQSLMPLVRDVAAQVARRLPAHVQLDDLVGAGMVGLAGALTRFDPERTESFKGYAEFRIRGAMLDELRRHDIMSRDARIQCKKLQRSLQQLSAERGNDVNDDDVAAHLGVSLEEYRELQVRLSSVYLVSSEHLDVIDERETPSEIHEDRELRKMLVSAIEDLGEREATVLWLFYYEELSLGEISELLGVTPSRICQIRTRAIEQLRVKIEARCA